MNDSLRFKLAFHRAQGLRLALVGGVFGALALASVSVVWGQQPEVRIAELQCDRNPEVVTITNQGSASQDLTGWTLKSDPVASESFDLSAVGTLAAGVSIFVQSGPAAQGSFVWSQQEIFRNNDAQDFVRLVDAAGTVVNEVSCQGATPTAPTAAATPRPTAAPTVAATPTPEPAGVVPTGGGPPGTESWQSAGLMAIAGMWLLAAAVGMVFVLGLRRGSRTPVTVPAVAAGGQRTLTASEDGKPGRWLYLCLVTLFVIAGLAAWTEQPRPRRKR